MNLSDLAFWVIIGACVFVLVRPGSPGPQIVSALGTASSAVVSAATGAAFTA